MGPLLLRSVGRSVACIARKGSPNKKPCCRNLYFSLSYRLHFLRDRDRLRIGPSISKSCRRNGRKGGGGGAAKKVAWPKIAPQGQDSDGRGRKILKGRLGVLSNHLISPLHFGFLPASAEKGKKRPLIRSRLRGRPFSIASFFHLYSMFCVFSRREKKFDYVQYNSVAISEEAGFIASLAP